MSYDYSETFFEQEAAGSAVGSPVAQNHEQRNGGVKWKLSYHQK